MKKLLLILLFIPALLFSQNSWVNIHLQTDNYPSETSWELLDNNGIVIAVNGTLSAINLYDTTINLNSGTYTINLYDSWGDGLGAAQWGGVDGWFFVENSCQDTLAFVAGDFGTLYTQTLIIAPCAPPTTGCTDITALNYDSLANSDDGSCLYISGCTDPIAQNFDSLATQDDGSCTYIVGCMNTNASNYDSTATQAWWMGTVVPGGSCNLTSWNNNYFGIDIIDWMNDPTVFSVGNEIYVNGYWYWIDGLAFPNNCNSPAVLVYVVGSAAACDGNIWTYEPGALQNSVPVGNTWYVQPCTFVYGCTDPLAFNYDSLAGINNYSCLFIEGCTDSTSMNYNPVATLDDGSCIGGGILCSPGEIELTIQIQLDYYTSETGWILSEVGVGILYEAPAGTYSSYSNGYVVTETYCIPEGTTLEFLINDTYGDGIYAPGGWLVYTGCDTISSGGEFGNNFTNQNFNYSYSDTGTVNSCITNVIVGCMDPGYDEFNPMANQMDSTQCINLLIYGCNDPTAFNYDSTATGLQQNPGCDNILTLTDWAGDGWAGSFLYVTQGTTFYGPYTVDSTTFIDTLPLNTIQPVNVFFYSYNQSQQTSNQCMFQITNPFGNVILEGGTNPYTNPIASYNQFNHMYSVMADCGDICIDRIYGCIDPLAFNFDSIANTTDNSCYYNPGCMDAAYLQYHTQGYVADYDDGSFCTTYAIFGCMDSTMFNYDEYATVQWNSVVDQTDPCVAKIFGCMDPTAFNYDPLANTEDYSCTPVIYGCMDMLMWNYDPTANTDNNSCTPYIYGCTDSTAFNFDPTANTNNSSCVPILLGCTDSTAINFNALANTDDNTCIAELLGCTDSTAINYNALANTDDGSCIATIYGCTDSTMFNYDPIANTNDGSCISYTYGCTDPLAYNYDPLANCDDNSCVPFVYGCTDNTMFNYDALANTDNGSCIPFIYGCVDSTMFNYDPLANTDNGSCISFIYGCTDNTALNFDPLANTLDNSCCYIGGCTDSTAVNYDPNACWDDNSCITPILGCTDVAAYNYNPAANVSDSTACLYDAGCYGGPGNPYWLNDGCYAWVIDVDDYCCTNDWDASCQSMYDYCTQGWPTAIEDISALGIVVFPNPTQNTITIETRLEIEVEVYDIMGKLLIKEENNKRLDLSDLANGLYNLSIIYNNKRYSTQIIKQ